MKLTREDFKEYVELYMGAWETFDKYADIIDSNFLDSLMFPLYSWMDEKLGLNKFGDVWSISELTNDRSKGIPIGVNEDMKAEYTKDLDLIYDKWVKEKE